MATVTISPVPSERTRPSPLPPHHLSLSLQDGHTPLHVAVLHSRPELAAALLLHGAALAPADADGRTALHLAAGRGLTELVAQLLEGGAEPELRDDEGEMQSVCEAV